MKYEVNEKTLAVVPLNEERCKIVEEDRTYNINSSSFKVIEHSCEYFGVSYKARLQGSYKLIKSRYKVPIIIEEASGMFVFNRKKGYTVIRFKNGFKMEIPVSFYSFNNQFLKASRLSSVVSNRMLRKC